MPCVTSQSRDHLGATLIRYGHAVVNNGRVRRKQRYVKFVY